MDQDTARETGGLSPDQINLLEQPLDPSEVSQRDAPGNSKKLSYIEANFAIAQANRIFGYGNWGHRIDAITRELIGDDLVFTALVTVTVRGCEPHQDVGIGIANKPQHRNVNYQDVEKASKEAASDGLKRALRVYGDQFGNSLYDKDNEIHAAINAVKSLTRASKTQTQTAAKPEQPAPKAAAPAQESDGALRGRVDAAKASIRKRAQDYYGLKLETMGDWTRLARDKAGIDVPLDADLSKVGPAWFEALDTALEQRHQQSKTGQVYRTLEATIGDPGMSPDELEETRADVEKALAQGYITEPEAQKLRGLIVKRLGQAVPA